MLRRKMLSGGVLISQKAHPDSRANIKQLEEAMRSQAAQAKVLI
jgi:hypothetical protein